MIDISNELFTHIKNSVEQNFNGEIYVLGESLGTPSKFPCVTYEEISNIPVHLDSAAQNKYARLNIRIQVFSNKQTGKRAEARKIYSIVDECLQNVGFHANSFSVKPNFYLTDIYQITSTYEAVTDRNGFIFRR